MFAYGKKLLKIFFQIYLHLYNILVRRNVHMKIIVENFIFKCVLVDVQQRISKWKINIEHDLV